MPVYALNLFDLVNPDAYRSYARQALGPLTDLGARVVAVGGLNDDLPQIGEGPRRAMILVEWPSEDAFRAYLDDPELTELHELRESGTENYLWWLYDRYEDVRPLVNRAD